MHSQAVKEALLAGKVAAERLAVLLRRVQAAVSNAIVIADCHRHTVYRVVPVFVALFMYLRQQSKKSLPECFRDFMQAAIEAALSRILTTRKQSPRSLDLQRFCKGARARKSPIPKAYTTPHKGLYEM